jgi:DNA-binding transcriptional MerR regulator
MDHAVNLDAAGRTGPNATADARRDSRTYTITELAQEFDITPRAIRFYEDMGLLAPGREGRNRVYSQRDRTRLKLTLRGKRLGLALQEIRQLVTMYDTESDRVPQLEAVVRTLGEHRAALTQQLDDIRVTLDEIEQHENRCRQLLTQARSRGEGGVESGARGGRKGCDGPDGVAGAKD